MAEYRVPKFTLEQRIDVTVQMMVPLPKRRWGLVSELTRQYGVSRTTLYKTRDRGLRTLAQALLPRDPGRPAQTSTLTVDKPFVDRVIAGLAMLKGSVRDIRLGLSLIFGVARSVGYISETLAAAGDVLNVGQSQLIKLGKPVVFMTARDEEGVCRATPPTSRHRGLCR
jgi:hypothetical protein